MLCEREGPWCVCVHMPAQSCLFSADQCLLGAPPPTPYVSLVPVFSLFPLSPLTAPLGPPFPIIQLWLMSQSLQRGRLSSEAVGHLIKTRTCIVKIRSHYLFKFETSKITFAPCHLTSTKIGVMKGNVIIFNEGSDLGRTWVFCGRPLCSRRESQNMDPKTIILFLQLGEEELLKLHRFSMPLQCSSLKWEFKKIDYIKPPDCKQDSIYPEVIYPMVWKKALFAFS